MLCLGGEEGGEAGDVVGESGEDGEAVVRAVAFEDAYGWLARVGTGASAARGAIRLSRVGKVAPSSTAV